MLVLVFLLCRLHFTSDEGKTDFLFAVCDERILVVKIAWLWLSSFNDRGDVNVPIRGTASSGGGEGQGQGQVWRFHLSRSSVLPSPRTTRSSSIGNDFASGDAWVTTVGGFENTKGYHVLVDVRATTGWKKVFESSRTPVVLRRDGGRWTRFISIQLWVWLSNCASQLVFLSICMNCSVSIRRVSTYLRRHAKFKVYCHGLVQSLEMLSSSTILTLHIKSTSALALQPSQLNQFLEAVLKVYRIRRADCSRVKFRQSFRQLFMKRRHGGEKQTRLKEAIS